MDAEIDQGNWGKANPAINHDVTHCIFILKSTSTVLKDIDDVGDVG